MTLFEADASTTEDALAGSNARYRMDAGLAVKFFNKAVMSPSDSEEAGRPIFKEKVYVSIEVPGDRLSRVVRPARQMDKQRFAEHYRRFLSREEQSVVDGTPLAEWGGVTRSQIEEMKFFKINTVEQLAALADSNTGSMRGLQTLKQKAQAYIDASDVNATTSALTTAKTEIEELKAQMAELLAAQPAPKKKRTRRTPAQMAEAKAAQEAAAEAALESIKVE
jgi:hypothetical protein